MSPEVEGSEKATRPGGRTFAGGVNVDGAIKSHGRRNYMKYLTLWRIRS
jgi:hypothetical protein